MMRWLDEWLHPEKKCERIGHKMRPWSRDLYLYPAEWSWAHVADTATETGETCRRCGHNTEPTVKRTGGLTGLSMESDKWTRLRANGRVSA